MLDILAFLLAVLIVVLIVLFLRQRKLIAQLRQESAEAEESKRIIIREQERNQQLKQEMTNNIAHELKTPVASIRGYLEILLGDKPVDEAKRRFFLERCYSQTVRLSDLIHDVSIINKLEESSDLFPKEPIDIRAIADEAVSELVNQSESGNATIFNNLPDGMSIMGNHSLLYAIFRNLMENAIHHAGEGVFVTLECYKADASMYYLHFYDNGRGVDNQYLEKIFDRFQRIDQGRSRKKGGTGLGLSIVKHAVIFHGGTIYAKNRELGGLEFFFSLKKS